MFKLINEIFQLSSSKDPSYAFSITVIILILLVYVIRTIGFIYMIGFRSNDKYVHSHYKKAYTISYIVTMAGSLLFFYGFLWLSARCIQSQAWLIILSLSYGITSILIAVNMLLKYEEERYPTGLFNVIETSENFFKEQQKYKEKKRDLLKSLNQQII